MKYVKVDDLQAYCDNQIDHSITPNDFQRMNHLEVVRCKECRFWKNQGTSVAWLPCMEVQTGGNWFCASGKK